MTSIQFQIDAERLRLLHGQRADSYARRREQERNARIGDNSAGAGSRDSYEALQLADRLPRSNRNQSNATQARDLPGYLSQARANSAALRFASVGGVALDLVSSAMDLCACYVGSRTDIFCQDNVDYEQLQELFPAPARGTPPPPLCIAHAVQRIY